MASALEIAYIMWESKLLEREIKELFNLMQSFETTLIYIVPSEKRKFENLKKEQMKAILCKLKKINKEISEFNKQLEIKEYIKFCDIDEITKIDSRAIKSILSKIEHRKGSILDLLKKDSTSFKDKEMRADNFRIKIKLIMRDTLESLEKIILSFIKITKRFESKKLKGTIYDKWIAEINDIFSVGYPELALFICGRTLEKIILDYMILLKKNKKINKTYAQIRKMEAEDRLNYLKGKFISEKDYHKIQSIKFDRNLIAHYSSIKYFLEAKKDSESDIKLAINLIERFHKKMVEQKKRKYRT